MGATAKGCVLEDAFTTTPDNRIWDFSPMRLGGSGTVSREGQFGRISVLTATQLEMFQNPLSVSRRTLGHTPFDIFAGFQVLDSDLFFGLLFLVSHLVT